MRAFEPASSRLSNDDVSTIGHAVSDERDPRSLDPELAIPTELGGVVADLKDAFLVPPDELTTRRHLAALAEARDDIEAASSRSRRARRRRRILVPIGVSGGLILATSGLAAAGELPAPIQHAVAAVAAPFGIDLPETDAPSAPQGTPGTEDDPSTAVTSTPAAPSGGPDADTSSPSPGADTARSAPGQVGTDPPPSDRAPEQSTGPGKSDQVPGHGGTNPGKSGQAPGHGGTDPGKSGQAPGHGGTNPGKSGQAPGHGGTNPGKSGQAPSPEASLAP